MRTKLMTLVNAFIFMISLMLFTLGTLNFEVQMFRSLSAGCWVMVLSPGSTQPLLIVSRVSKLQLERSINMRPSSVRRMSTPGLSLNFRVLDGLGSVATAGFRCFSLQESI